MTYSLHPATIEDAPAIAEIFQKAFENDHIMGHFHPETPKDILVDKDIKYFTKAIAAGTIYGERYTKVVDESAGGEMVAFAAWQYPYHLTAEQQAEKERKAEEAKMEPRPPGSQVALLDDFFEKISAGRKKWINPEKTFCMCGPTSASLAFLYCAEPWSFRSRAYLGRSSRSSRERLGWKVTKDGLEGSR